MATATMPEPLYREPEESTERPQNRHLRPPFAPGQNSQTGEVHRRGPDRKPRLTRGLMMRIMLEPIEIGTGKHKRTVVPIDVFVQEVKKNLIRRGNFRSQQAWIDLMYQVFDKGEEKSGDGPGAHVTNIVLSGPAAERLARAQLEAAGLENPTPEGEGGDGDTGQPPTQSLLDDDGNELKPMEPMG